jgi:hypothetical protein
VGAGRNTGEVCDVRFARLTYVRFAHLTQPGRISGGSGKAVPFMLDPALTRPAEPLGGHRS